MIGIGMYRVLVLHEGVPPKEIVEGSIDLTQAAGIIVLLRAFSAGSVALTGTEAIANGVQAFKPPEPRNAAATLTAMAILLAVLFVGITFVADSFGLVPARRPGHGPRLADHRGPDRVDHLRQRLDRLLPLPGVHRPHPLPGRQHRLQRLPAAGRHPGRGRLHAAPVLVPWRPTGLQPGHHRARRRGRRAGRHLPRRDDRPHPALLGRRLRQLHHQPERHGPSLAPRADAGLGLPHLDQRLRGRPDRRRLGRRADLQGARVAPRRGHHPGPGRDHALHRAPVPASRRRSSRSAPTRSSGRHAAASVW